MKKLLLTLLLFSLFAPLTAQVNENKCKFRRENFNLGFAAGWSTGFGISARYWFKDFGLQYAFTPLMLDDERSVSNGLTFLYILDRTRFINIFAYQGNHFLYNWEEEPGNDWYFLNTGLGVGVEAVIARKISLNIMGGYASYNESGHYTWVFLTGEAGLFYKF